LCRVDGNGHSWSRSCCGMRIENRCRRRRRMMGRSGRRCGTWTRAVQGPRSRSESWFDDVRFSSLRKIDLDSDSDDFFASLCEEGALLAFEKITGGAWTHFKVIWWSRGKHGHQVVTCWWSRVFACGHIRCVAEIKF
jgi:hypothetical protein